MRGCGVCWSRGQTCHTAQVIDPQEGALHGPAGGWREHRGQREEGEEKKTCEFWYTAVLKVKVEEEKCDFQSPAYCM